MNRLYTKLALHVRRGMGERLGDRRFPGRPQAAGFEVETWSAYAPGDDLRHLDWNAAARLDVWLMRRFVAEREVLFHFLLDRSASMGLPAVDRKRAAADALVGALAWVALSANDAVRVTLLPGDGPPEPSPVLRHRASAATVSAWLARTPPSGALDLGAALATHASRHPRPAATILVSDFLVEPATLEAGIQALRARRHEVVLLQVIGRGELEPSADLAHGELRDVESGATHAIALTSAARARYQALVAEHGAALADLAARHQAVFARLVGDENVVGFVTGELARLGLVRRR
jgi:uncharacterized protein (DUF58 family)